MERIKETQNKIETLHSIMKEYSQAQDELNKLIAKINEEKAKLNTQLNKIDKSYAKKLKVLQDRVDAFCNEISTKIDIKD